MHSTSRPSFAQQLRSRSIGSLVVWCALALLSLTAAPHADAAQCQYFAASGIKVCGSFTQNVTGYNGIEYTQSSRTTWTLTKLDSTLSISNVKIRILGYSSCVGGYPLCSTFNNNNRYSAGVGTWYVTTFPFANKWGSTSGNLNAQIARLEFTWCRRGSCVNETSLIVGRGSYSIL